MQDDQDKANLPQLDLDGALQAALQAVEALDQRKVAPARSRDAVQQELDEARAELAEARQTLERTQAELVQAQADLAANRRRYQRLEQEHDEQRKRQQRLEMDLPVTVTRRVLGAMLPMLDDLDTLTGHLLAHEHLSAHAREAVHMVRTHTQRGLSQLDVQTFDAIGQRFDPAVHEVIAQVEHDDVPEGHVVRQAGRGYLLGGRLLRSARVVVRKAKDS